MSTDEGQQVSSEAQAEEVKAEVTELPPDPLAPQPDDDVPVTQEVTPEVEPDIPDLPPLEPPAKWDRRYKEAWDRLNSIPDAREVQEAWIEQYKQTQGYITPKEQELAQLRQSAEPLLQVAQEYQDMARYSGTSMPQLIRQSLGLAARLQQDPRGTLLSLAQGAGINLQELTQEQPYIDPALQNTQQELHRLRNEIRQREQRQAQEYQQRVQAETYQQLQSFAEAKDEQGNPKHPHLEIVEGAMAQLIHGREAQRRNNPSIPSMSLDEAYAQACKLTPEVEQADERIKAQREAARKTAEAKRAQDASRRVAGKHTGLDAVEEGSTEDEIRRLYRKSIAA